VFCAGTALAADPRPKDDAGIFSISIENDLFAEADQHYTSGIRLSYLSAENNLPHWIEAAADAFPLFGPGSKRRVGFALGQTIYTPGNIKQAVPDPRDRPYAGFLFGSIGVVSESQSHIDILEVDFGVVGPESQAERTQKFVHRVTGADQPRGWSAQLDNEPGIVLSYQRKWRGLYEFSPFGLGADVTPYVGANVGNVLTQGAVGLTLRVGYDLPADYGPPRVRPSLTGSDYFLPRRDFGWYLFAGIEGRVVGQNIFLDGNTFSTSARVDKKPLVGDVQFGVAFTVGDVRVAYTHVIATEEFHGQDRGDQFGSFSLSVRF
jgi:lipid A 3-O-deacylase